jgi:hypothetical protein
VSSKSTYKDMRAKAKLPEGTVEVCFRGDLVAEFEGLERELEQAPKSDSLDSGEGAIRERMEAIRAEMRENTYPVRLRGLPGPKYRALTEAHPPRRDDEGNIVNDDRIYKVNEKTFFPVLLRLSVIDPELVTRAADWDDFESSLSDYQWSELTGTAFMLNRGPVTIPLLRGGSRTNRSSGGE